MATFIDTVQRFRKIEEATAQKDDPAPVYLLDEIADMARQSPEQAQAISDAVLKKLQVKSPVVKFKALRIIKHLCVKGCSQFQRCMQRNSSAVRELIHWRGEPDPFKGDVPNARVREFSKDVVEVLFNSAPITNTNNTLAAQGKIQGFGSGGPGEAAACSSSGHYGGIGSSGSNMGSGSYSGGFRSSGSSGLAAAQQAASQLTHAAQQALGEGPIAQGLASAANAIGGLLQPAGYGSRLNESGSYQDGGSDGFGYSSSSSYAAPAVSHVTASQVLGSEESVVDDITAPGGLRPLPDAADLRRFVDTASSMDGLRIAELLREKMESARWQVVLRALAALEAVLQRGSNQACGEVAVMFQSDPQPIRACLQSPQQQVQARAAAVLKLLLGEDVAVPAAAAASSKAGGKASAAAAAAKAPAMDLLIDDSPLEPAAAAAAAPPSAAAGIDLLGDLSSPAAVAPAAAPAAAAPAAASVDALFDGLGVSAGAPAAATPAAAGGDDMFGGLTVAAPVPGAAAAAPAAAAAAPSKPAPLDDLLSGLAVGGSSSSPAANGSSGNLLSGFSPVKQQQQPQLTGMLPMQQQHQQQALPMQQPDLLGDFSMAAGPQQMMMQQQQLGFGMQPQLQVNGLQQQQRQQQHFGMPGLGMQQQQQPQQQWGMPTMAAGAFPQQQQHGMHMHSGSSGGAAAGSSAWKGHDDVSNLMRQVGHGGKYDPAFDFVSDEFKKH